MSGVFTLKALGLNTSPNQLETPPGSLTMASNVNITRSDVIEPRRGFKIYGDAFGSSSDRAKQLFSYKLRILRHFANTLQFDNGNGVFSDFFGSFTEAQAGLRTKSVEMNGNLYLTSSDGIKKISALTADDLTTAEGVVIDAGAIAAVDITGYPNYIYGDQTDFLVQDSAVAYRVVWGYRDNNNNLILGTPSQRIEVYNYLLSLLLPDYMRVLGALDNIGTLGSLIDDQDYVNTLGLGSGATASDLYTNLLALTAKLDKDITYADNYHDQGSWDASTNTPTLHNNVLTIDDTYIVSVAGTQDLGNGPVTYNVSDVLTYDGSNWNVNSQYTYKGLWDPNYVSLGSWDASLDSPTLNDGIGTPFNFYTVTEAGILSLATGSQQYVNNGSWNATTNTPTLANGTGTAWTFYTVSVAGTHNFGAGPIGFSAGDQVYYNGSIWQKPTSPIQTFAIGDFIYYTGSQWLKSPTPIIYLQDGTGNIGDLYRVSATGSHQFGSGTISFVTNDFVSYDGTIWSKNTDLIYLADWNASTNTPTIYSTAVKNGFFYTVSVAGTQDLGAGPVSYLVGDRLIFNDGLWVVNNATITSNSPLKIASAVITNGICTITFSSGNPSLYVTSGDTIGLTGFNIANVTPGININTTTTPFSNFQTVTSADTTTIVFNTTVVGVVDVDATATITSNKFGAITQPTAPVIPATDADLVGLQTYLQNIINALNSELNAVIPTAVSAAYIAPLTITTASTVTLNITIPAGITPNYFFQIYRSTTFTATGVQVLSTDVVPNDELFLVYEATPTAAQLAAGSITVIDATPDAFLGAALYTNASTGEGILQSNNIPPFALDIAVFKNSVFYANTHTPHQFSLSLLGVQNMISDFNNGIIPSITIATDSGSNTYTFIVGSVETFTITCNAGSTLAASGTASYFDLTSGNNQRKYRFWYNIGTAVAPPDGGRILFPILATAGDNSTVIAQKTRDAINQQNLDFSATSSANVISVSCEVEGITDAPVDGTTGFIFTVTHAGTGENAADKQILLSSNISPALAVQLTAQSLVRVINQNPNETVYAYYTSGSQDVPGQLSFQSRTLGGEQFFITTNDPNTGLSFNPGLSPTVQITSIAAGTSIVTTATPHGLVNLDFIVVSGSNSTPSIDGVQQINYISPTSFTLVGVTITGSGNTGGFIPFVDAESSSNNSFPNRVYYSKLQQPEAVPGLNFFDVGARDKEILRIYPLRDSLFIFKQDGIYRISGEEIPFNLGLFDSSCIIVSPDSVSSVDNTVYLWSRQGISTVTESGTRNLSRPIDNLLLPLSSAGYTNFVTTTWGLGYESDKSYTVYTVSKTTDLAATQAFKYNTLTNAWTTLDRDSVCGVINFLDDKMYLGAGDTNFIEQERKAYTREDFADREYDVIIQPNLSGTIITLDNVNNIAIDDVIVQTQPISVYTFNSLLKMLDTDPGIMSHTFFANLAAVPGDSLRSELLALATQLDTSSLEFTNYAASIGDLSGSITAISTGPIVTVTSAANGLLTGRVVSISSTNSIPSINGEYVVTVVDANNFTIDTGFTVTTAGTTGSFSTVSTSFADLNVSYNEIINKLNADSVVIFANYALANNTFSQETLITGVNVVAKTITVAQPLPFIQGDAIIYKAIDCEVIYSPYTFGGDPISPKHIREAQLFFDNLAFTKGIMNFASDLMPAFIPVPFNADGTGLFGLGGNFGSGFFGGNSDSAPIRTYIPRDAQRCRYMIVGFQHTVARDKWALNGITLTGDILQSSRAYR